LQQLALGYNDKHQLEPVSNNFKVRQQAKLLQLRAASAALLMDKPQWQAVTACWPSMTHSCTKRFN
jgi:hypothetical protein